MIESGKEKEGGDRRRKRSFMEEEKAKERSNEEKGKETMIRKGLVSSKGK